MPLPPNETKTNTLINEFLAGRAATFLLPVGAIQGRALGAASSDTTINLMTMPMLIVSSSTKRLAHTIWYLQFTLTTSPVPTIFHHHSLTTTSSSPLLPTYNRIHCVYTD